jgi:dihydrofolate reductase
LSISIIAATDLNGLIGANGGMPWHIPEELAWFKQHTMGKIVVMGRKTWVSLGKQLPGRRNIVLSTNLDFVAEGAELLHTTEQVIALAKANDVFIIGGAELFRQFLPIADRLYISTIHAEYSGDTFFPYYDTGQWQQTHCESITTAQDIQIDFCIHHRLQA